MFRDEIKDWIRARRRQGYGINLPEKYAFLSLDEVLAIRLYSGPAYQPINTFLRAFSFLKEHSFRKEMGSHAGLTFAATVRHIIHGIRKLSAILTEEEASKPLWRGVRGQLPDAFWVPDKAGAVVAVDMAFMSTSRNRQTPIDYMNANSENVLWSLQAKPESDAGYHCGADISRLSQFSEEAEVLYPPCTMLTVTDKAKMAHKWRLRETKPQGDADRRDSAKSDDGIRTEGGDKHFLSVDVVPTFV